MGREWPAHRWDWPNRLRASMKYAGVSPKELAEMSDVSIAMIRMMMSRKPSNQRNASPMVQAAIAEALGEDPGWVFPRTYEELCRARSYRDRFVPLGSVVPRHGGLEVAHSYVGEVRDVAEL